MIRKCGQCGSRNDPKRVICNHCGARLPEPEPDGGEMVALPTAYQPPPPVYKGRNKERAKLKTMRPRHTGRNILLLLGVGILAAMAWVGSKALEPVPGLKPPVAPNTATAALLEESLFKSISMNQGRWIGETRAVNQFLAAKVRSRSVLAIGGKELIFQRCHIEAGKGTLDLVMVLDADGRPIICRLSMVPVAEDGGTGVRITGASIGSLAIPAFVAGYLSPLWKPCVAPFQGLLQGIASAKQVDVTPESLVFQWSESQR